MRLVRRRAECGHDDIRPIGEQVGLALVPDAGILRIRPVPYLPHPTETRLHIVSADDATDFLLGADCDSVQVVQFRARRAEQAGRREQWHALFEITRLWFIRVFHLEELAEPLQLRPVIPKAALRYPRAARFDVLRCDTILLVRKYRIVRAIDCRRGADRVRSAPAVGG